MQLIKQLYWLIFFFICSLLCQLQTWDIELLKIINLHRYRPLDDYFIVLTELAAPFAYSVPLFLLIFALNNNNHLLKSKALYIIKSILLALVVCTLLKHIINRPRPFETYSFIEKLSTGSSPSFPSGHTTDAFALASSLMLAFSLRYLTVILFFWALLVGYSRMHLGVHYPTDVLASVLIAYGCSFFVWKFSHYKEKWMGQVKQYNEVLRE